MTPVVTRTSVRQLFDRHLHVMMQGHISGRWHAAQLDVQEEVDAAASEVAVRFGHAEAERFRRMYTEEMLAFERDMRASPVETARSVFGGREPADGRPLLIHRPPCGTKWISIVVGAFILLHFLT